MDNGIILDCQAVNSVCCYYIIIRDMECISFNGNVFVYQ